MTVAMKKNILLISGLILCSGLFAQNSDTLLRRQLELERQFNPTLQDANKINSLPALPVPNIKKADASYATWAGHVNPPIEIAIPGPAAIATEIPYSLQKGYISMSAGNYANINGALGYRIIDNDNSKLNFLFLHQSTNGDIKFVQNSDPSSNTAYRMDNGGQLAYAYRFAQGTFKISGGYSHSAFNYYGNTFGNERVFDNKHQTLGLAHLLLGLQSTESDNLNYAVRAEIKNFSTKFGTTIDESGLGGNQTKLAVELDKPFDAAGSDAKIGVEGNWDGVFLAKSENPAIDLYNYHLIDASPFISFEGLNWKARLGANVQFQFADDDKVRVAPNVQLSVKVADHSSLYANIEGGFDSNTILDMMNESRYVQPMLQVKPSFTLVDLEAGAKIGSANGVRFDIFGGYRQTDNEHFLLAGETSDNTSSVPTFIHAEYLTPIYGNLSRSHVGAMLQIATWSPLDLTARFSKNFYSIKDISIDGISASDAKAYNKPGYELDCRASFEVSQQIKLTLNYYLAGDRWSYFEKQNVKMKNINDLNLGAIYSINDAFSIHLNANNLLAQKYDIWYGYAAQGFNAMGGFSFKF